MHILYQPKQHDQFRLIKPFSSACVSCMCTCVRACVCTCTCAPMRINVGVNPLFCLSNVLLSFLQNLARFGIVIRLCTSGHNARTHTHIHTHTYTHRTRGGETERNALTPAHTHLEGQCCNHIMCSGGVQSERCVQWILTDNDRQKRIRFVSGQITNPLQNEFCPLPKI